MRLRVLTLFGVSIFVTFLISSAFALPVVSAQTPADCPDFVKAALEATNKDCADTGRNQICYGNVSIKAEPQPGIADFKFDQPGNIIDLASLQKLQLSGLNSDDKTWGVALMRMQANLADTAPGQIVTMLIFGDVQIENAVPPASTTIDVKASNNVPVRAKPNGTVLARLADNQIVKANGRLNDNSWLRIEVVDSAKTILGWVPLALVSESADVSSLDVIDPDAPVFGPMQAFYFRTGTGTQACKEVPHNGIMVQSPKGGKKVTLSINDVTVSLGSTAYITALDRMWVYTVEGSAQLQVNGVTRTIPAGYKANVPLDANSQPSGPPTQPQVYSPQDVQGLPLIGLPEQITIAPPGNVQPSTPGAAQSLGTPGSAASLVCPSGSAVSITMDGVTRRAACTCASGTRTVVGTANGVAFSAEVCN